MARPSNPEIIKTCPNCKNTFKIKSWKKNKYCSVKCSQIYTKSKDKKWLEKRDITNIQKYGVKSPLENPQILKKYKQNFINKYGVDNPFLVEEFKIKSEESILNKYGVKIATQNKKVSEKISKALKGGEKNRSNFVEIKWDKIEIYCNETDLIPLFDKNDLMEHKLKDKKFIFKCTKCESIMEVSLNNGYLPTCSCSNYKGYSIIEEEISKFIINNYEGKVNLKVKGLIPKYEIDIYLPELNIAFEVDGIYWHSENLGKYRDYHLYKTEKCLSKGIELIHIFDIEWLRKKPIIQSIILNKINKIKNKIHARKCDIKIISNEECKQFLIDNHRQGYCPSKYRLGLYYDGNLVSVMTFGKNRFKNDNNLELLRFCNKINTIVVGGAGKLFKYFNENININKLNIISFADRRYSTGKVYRNLNFEFVSFSKPSYFYWKNNEILNRISCQKHKLHKILDKFDESLSEYDNMKLNKWYRVWDCGNYKFIYKNNK